MSEEQKNNQRASFTAHYTGNDVSNITAALQTTLFSKSIQSGQHITAVNTTYTDDKITKFEDISGVKLPNKEKK